MKKLVWTPTLKKALKAALLEDGGAAGDVTSKSLVPAAARVRAVIVSRGAHVVSGQAVAAEIFRLVDRRVRYRVKKADGAVVRAGDVIAALEGPARAVLFGERTALNFLQRMTGVATQTKAFVDAVRPFGTLILDTRKTTPGWRALEKHAVLCGGGTNHRFGLFDKVLIKDNHRALWSGQVKRSLADAVREARRRYPKLEIEIEVESESELRDALDGGPDWVLLDNMSPTVMRRCVKIAAGRCKLEASGGINLGNVAAAAATGVDAISIGALTHSVKAADLSLEFLPARR